MKNYFKILQSTKVGKTKLLALGKQLFGLFDADASTVVFGRNRYAFLESFTGLRLKKAWDLYVK